MKWFGLELTEICFFYSYQKWHSKKCLNDALCHNCNIFTCTQSISMKLILLESYEADLSNSGYNIQFGEELTEIQTNLYSVCKHSDTFLAHCKSILRGVQCGKVCTGVVSMRSDRDMRSTKCVQLCTRVYDSRSVWITRRVRRWSWFLF